MRAMFGLVGILMVVGIIVWLLAGPAGDQLQTVSSANKSAREEVNQMAGNDPDTGARASESAKVELVMSGGKPDSVLVTSVTAGGAYERFFGLKQDDSILQIGPLAVKDHPAISNDEDAETHLLDAYQRKQQLVVMRNGERVTLPAAAAQKPPQGAGSDSKDPLQQQLEGIGARKGL